MDAHCWLSPQQALKCEEHFFNVLRFARKVDHLVQVFRGLREMMGALYSSLKRKRQQQKTNRILIKNNMNQLREYGLALDRELELANEHIQELLSKDISRSWTSISLSSLSNFLESISLCSVKNIVDSGVDMAGSSKDKDAEKIAGDNILVFAEERCGILDENLRLLDGRKDEIDQDIQATCARLKRINTKAESFRFRHFVSKNPIDSWSVTSMPF